MTQQEIQERNKQIALMLWGEQTNPKNREPEWHIGYDLPYCDEDGYFKNIGAMDPITVPLMQFHSDYNWIMDAVKFISNKSSLDLKLDGRLCVLQRRVCHLPIFAKKEAVFIAVSDFAKLYNEEKP